MKNRIYTVPLLSALLATLLFVTACTQEPIFYDIAQEIKLEEASIQGNVFSIVKLKGNLYTANGKIYGKPLHTVRGWSEISKPDDRRVVQLASDDTDLYALTAEQTDTEGDAHSYQVWALLGGAGGWQKVGGTESAETVVIFDNAVVGTAAGTTGRNAYVRVDGVVKKLNGDTAFESLSAHGGTVITGSEEKNVIAAAKLANDDYFADTRAFCSNGTDKLYKANGTNIQHGSTSTNLVDSNVSADENPLTFAFDSTNKKILVGTDDGLQEVTLETNGMPKGVSNLPGNAEATTGESEIFSVASFGAIDGNAIYVGASKRYNSKYNALWGYYTSRGNWNYE